MLQKRAREIGDIIKNSREVHIVTHIDADGITAGCIAYQTLQRLGKECSIEFVKQLDESVLTRLKDENYELVWFTDLGSNISTGYPEINKVITDHHTCSIESNQRFHLNPHLFNLDGGFEISGAGVTYLVSKTIDKKNMDLSQLAVVGACGDLQDRKYNKLSGLNRNILDDGESVGVVKAKIDIRYFGRETRPVYKLLQYASDPVIPGLSGRESACISFLDISLVSSSLSLLYSSLFSCHILICSISVFPISSLLAFSFSLFLLLISSRLYILDSKDFILLSNPFKLSTMFLSSVNVSISSTPISSNALPLLRNSSTLFLRIKYLRLFSLYLGLF